MIIHLKHKNEPFGSAALFLNQPALDFYEGKIEFDDPNYPMFIKSAILMAMNELEGSIKGQFNTDLFLRGINDGYVPLNRMYPVGCEVLKGKDIGFILSEIRNINAHARPSINDIAFLKKNSNFSNVYNVTRFNKMIKTMLPGGVLTMGGLITIVMLFLKAATIKVLCRTSNVFKIIACENFSEIEGNSFVEKISHVNLECPIRETKGTDLISSIFGEYQDRLEIRDGFLHLEFGPKSFPTYVVDVKIDNVNNIVTVKSGSLTKTYYKKEYRFPIYVLDEFIRLSNELPPFVLIDLLYELKIEKFDRAALEIVESKWNLYSKLNYPKFYSDKNISILLLPNTVSDLRITSSAISNALSSVFLRFEEKILKKYGYNDVQKYSRISDSLQLLGLSEKLIPNLVVLRNASMHGYILGQYVLYNDISYEYSLEFIVSTLHNLLSELNGMNSDLYNYLQNDINEYIARKIIGLKYSSAVEYALDSFNGHPKFDPVLNANKVLHAVSSFFDTALLNALYLEAAPLSVIECHIDKEELPVFIFNNEKQISLLNQYLYDKYGAFTSVDELDGLIQKVYITTK